MADDPRVSVIIPTYQRAQWLGRAIDSVLAQTMPHFELIVVDDGSTDETDAVVSAYRDGRIRYIQHGENLGSSEARNTGVEASRGEYVAFLDSDDEWLPRKLARQLDLFEESVDTELGAVNCGLIYDGGGKVPTQMWMPSARGWVFPTVLSRREYHDTASMWLIRRTYLDELEGPFDERLRYTQVADLLVRLARLCRFDYVPELLLIYHDHNTLPKNALYPIELRRRCYDLYVEKHRADLEQHPKAFSWLLTMYAARYLGEGLSAEARRNLVRAVRLDALYVRAWVLLLFSVVGRDAYALARTLRRRVSGGRMYGHRIVENDEYRQPS